MNSTSVINLSKFQFINLRFGKSHIKICQNIQIFTLKRYLSFIVVYSYKVVNGSKSYLWWTLHCFVITDQCLPSLLPTLFVQNVVHNNSCRRHLRISTNTFVRWRCILLLVALKAIIPTPSDIAVFDHGIKTKTKKRVFQWNSYICYTGKCVATPFLILNCSWKSSVI